MKFPLLLFPLNRDNCPSYVYVASPQIKNTIGERLSSADKKLGGTHQLNFSVSVQFVLESDFIAS